MAELSLNKNSVSVHTIHDFFFYINPEILDSAFFLLRKTFVSCGLDKIIK